MIAVLDIGKTNVKLSAARPDGTIVETLSLPNASHPAPPYRHHDLAALETWIADALRQLGQRHAIGAIVPCGHGSGAVLVDAAGPVMPMIDYEAEPPEALNALYRRLAGSYRQRGSAIMLGASHIARQLLWLDTGWPQALAQARWFLALPQYWAWRLCGVAASEATCLGAQSHLWSAADGADGPIVAARGWHRLLPPMRRAWDTLGPLSPDWAARTGLAPATRVLCGIHDSSANFYRYRAAGLRGLTVISTGTWIVGLSDETGPDDLEESRGMSCNADPDGRPLAGALCMGGREFALIAGPDALDGAADADAAAALIERGTLALPFFTEDDGLLPGRAGLGRIDGPPPRSAAERRALALLATALLTDLLLDTLHSRATVVLDGTLAADPLYAAIIAGLRPGQPIRFSRESYGPAAGAALLAGHATRSAPSALPLDAAPLFDHPGLPACRVRWRALAGAVTETFP